LTPLRAILDGIETHVRGDLIGQAIEAAERQSLITAAEAGRLRESLTARRLGGDSER
jgi:hypothetical protein